MGTLRNGLAESLATQNHKGPSVLPNTPLNGALSSPKNNAALPVAQLPPEILCWIFELFKIADYFPFDPFSMSWTRVTHVCASWRRIAISCPTLWNNIHDAVGLMWANEMLKRSVPAPLTVSAVLNIYKVQNLQAIFSHAQRFRKLSISVPFDHPATLVQQVIDTGVLVASAPLLEDLRVCGRILTDILEEDLFLGRTPRLRHLQLFECILPSDLPMLQGPLTTLHISFLDFFSDGRIPISEVVTILRGISTLENLVLINALLLPFSPPADSPLPQRTVNLPHLKFLHVETGPSECGSFLDHLVHLPPTNIKLRCSFTPHSTDVSRLLPSLAYWSNETQNRPEPFIGLKCKFKNHSDICLTLSTTRDLQYDEEFSLRLMCVNRGSKVFVMLDPLLKVLPLEKLVHLNLIKLPKHRAPQWLLCFAHLRTLKNIDIDDNEAGVVRALSTVLPPDSCSPMQESGPIHVPFPALAKLSFLGCNLDSVDEGRTLFDRLFDTLGQRQKYKQGVGVYFESCRSMTSTRFKKLSTVADVEWDDDESYMGQISTDSGSDDEGP
ncbi:hypothetical protein Hypma_006101 [Hypsizygus marmoreus]|uniref:F-box domain-containing protein n=1 Tax=Hypsizygus marmoreus TaxID=39966 RepID=A0A369JUH7_HYPMA|nr:hypothetical protein Hypma_006101 [Hypsizygus marmoreus]